MSFWKKLTVTMAIMGSSKTVSAAGASSAAVATAAYLGLDWLPWAVGAAGSTVVYAYKPPSTRAKALANGVISVFLGGVGGPALVDVASNYFEVAWLSNFSTVLLASGVLAVAWPWAAPVIFSGLVGMWNGFTQGVAGRQKGDGQ